MDTTPHNEITWSAPSYAYRGAAYVQPGLPDDVANVDYGHALHPPAAMLQLAGDFGTPSSSDQYDRHLATAADHARQANDLPADPSTMPPFARSTAQTPRIR